MPAKATDRSDGNASVKIHGSSGALAAIPKGRDRRSRHLDPSSTFVLPEVTRGAPPSAAERYDAKHLKNESPEAIEDIQMPDDPEGRYKPTLGNVIRRQWKTQAYSRGLAKHKKGDLDGAIADFNRAIKLGVTTY